MIRPFHFRLQPVLELRERREEMLRRELGQALVALSQGQERAVAAEKALEMGIVEMRGEAGAVTTIHELRRRHDDIERLRREVAVERATAHQLEEAAIDRRAELVRASQEREALATLKRHARHEHARNVARDDQVVMDELAQRRARHRPGGHHAPSGAAA